MILGIKGWTNEVDNKSTINIAHNLVQHDCTKHIENDRHFIKEKLDSGLITTPFVFQAINRLMS